MPDVKRVVPLIYSGGSDIDDISSLSRQLCKSHALSPHLKRIRMGWWDPDFHGSYKSSASSAFVCIAASLVDVVLFRYLAVRGFWTAICLEMSKTNNDVMIVVELAFDDVNKNIVLIWIKKFEWHTALTNNPGEIEHSSSFHNAQPSSTLPHNF